MALFESYERRIDKINGVLAEYGISSIEEAEKITKDAGLNVYDQIKGIQPICFENACWAYTVGAAIAIKKGCKKAADAAAAVCFRPSCGRTRDRSRSRARTDGTRAEHPARPASRSASCCPARRRSFFSRSQPPAAQVPPECVRAQSADAHSLHRRRCPRRRRERAPCGRSADGRPARRVRRRR